MSRSNVLLDHVSTTNKLSKHVYYMPHVSDQTIILIFKRREKYHGGGGGTINTSTGRQTCTTTSTTLSLYLRPELRHRTFVTGCTGRGRRSHRSHRGHTRGGCYGGNRCNRCHDGGCLLDPHHLSIYRYSIAQARCPRQQLPARSLTRERRPTQGVRA